MKIIISILVVLGIVSASYSRDKGSAFPEHRPVPYDSISFDGYKAIQYQYQDSAGNMESVINILRLFKDGKEVIASDDGKSEMFNFCRSLAYIKSECYLQDINKDGIKEIIVEYSTVGGSCCEGAGRLYSMGDSIRLLLEMLPADTPFQIRDYENDSIPEIVTVDGVFQFFFDYSFRAFMEPLFWKWDSDKYRVANKQFADSILNALGPNQMPRAEDLNWVDSVQLSASHIIGVPSYQFLDMVFGYYAAGMPDKADSLFNQYWPQGVDGRDLYFKEIKNRVKHDPYYPQILDSDW